MTTMRAMWSARRRLGGIPGVGGGRPLVGNLFDLRADRLGLQRAVAARCGDIGRVQIGPFPVVMVTSAPLAHEVLVEKADAFVKSRGLSVVARPLLGDGLLTSEDPLHKRQRRLLAPAFHARRLAGYAAAMARRTDAAIDGWRDGATLDAAEEMMTLTLGIVAETLFGADVSDDVAEVARAITVANQYIADAVTRPWPPSWPTPASRRNRRAVAALDAVLYRLIAARRQSVGKNDDLLSMLVEARDDDGSAMSDKQVRDEAMTLFLAGHETTANALAWALDLLGRHDDARARLEAEADEILGGKAPGFADLARLPWATACFKEAMRLYPPAYLVGRCAARDVRVGDHDVPAGTTVLVATHAMHRRADYFAAPDAFRPERFLDEKSLVKGSFLPFGGGPRICIGNGFALVEGPLVLAAIAARVALAPVESTPPEPEPLVTLRPKGGVPVRVRLRR